MKAPAHFFKFIQSDANSHSIPNSFRKYLKSTRKNEIAILRRGDQEWEVKIGDDWVFGEGWDDFMTENDVQDFDVVVFKHEGNMVFDTMIFDTTWCEREYSNNQVIKSVKKRKLDNNALRISKGKDICINQSRKSLLKAEKSSYSMLGLTKVALTNPYFRSTVTAYSIKRAIVTIPIAFARSNKIAMRNCEVFVMDEKQRRWPTRLTDSGGRVRIYGSPDMLVANGLKEGDVLLLELVDNGNKPLMNLYALRISKGKDTCINQSRKSLLKAEKSSKTMIPNQNHHPCFVNTLKQHGTVKTMYIPNKFAFENGLSSGEMIFKTVETEGLWTVYLRSHWDKYFYIQRGLREFCSAIGLEKGDSFQFELIDNGKKPVAIVSRLPKVALTNPYFRSTVTAYSIKRAIVNIPIAFARSNKLAMRNCELFVMDEKQRRWPTRLTDSGGRVRIYGSPDMLVANGLKEGDVLLLELVDNGNKPLMNLYALRISKGKDTCINQSRKSLLKAEKSSKAMIPNQNQHPCFVSTLKQHGTVKTMYLPNKFALANGLSSGEMIFKNVENEGLWTVYLRNHQGKFFYVRSGLREFCSSIGLEKGDSFRFELIDNGKKPVAIVSSLPKVALTNPYFRSTVTAYSIKRAIVTIPIAFARSNKLAMRDCELLVMDEKQRLFPMRLCQSGHNVCIHRSRNMLVANGLKEGDVFLLEVVDNGNKPLMNFHRHGSAQLKLT